MSEHTIEHKAREFELFIEGDTTVRRCIALGLDERWTNDYYNFMSRVM